MNSVMPTLDWDPQGQAFAFISISASGKAPGSQTFKCLLDECSSQKARRLHFFNTDHFIGNFCFTW